MLNCLLTIVGTVAAIIAALTNIIMVGRTPKRPDPPYQPSLLYFGTVRMNEHVRDLYGHRRS